MIKSHEPLLVIKEEQNTDTEDCPELLTPFQRFDNWLWHNEHETFRKQACMQSTLF